jgi:putative aldouronate transport system permease protein
MTVPRTSSKTWIGRYLKQKDLVLMTLPVLLFFAIFHYLPMTGLIIAFKDYILSEGVLQSRWIGLENFQQLFGSDEFPQALRNTFIISFLRLLFGFFAPVILALLLNEIRVSWFKRTIQTMTYLPYFISWVILGGIFIMMFSNAGPVNQIIRTVSGNGLSVDFLGKDYPFIAVLIVTGIWQSAGYAAVIYLSALAGINPTLYEAAVVDGADRWQQTRHVTIPCLMPTMITLFILSLASILNAGFDQIYNMYNPMVYDAADIVDTYVLRRLMDTDFGLATAAGLFKSVVGMVMVVLVNTAARRLSHGEQGIW